MFDLFTSKAIKVIMFAQAESRRLNHGYVGTEQILLGLIADSTGVASKVLKSLGLNLKDTRIEVKKIIGRGSGFCKGGIPFSPKGKEGLEFSLEEARQLGHNYVGTEHLLLGIVRDGEGTAVEVLENLVIDTTKLRTHVIRELAEQEEKTSNSDEDIKQSDTAVNCKDKINKIKQSDNEIYNREDNDLVSLLERLASLKREGLLTNKEFVEAKRKLLF